MTLKLGQVFKKTRPQPVAKKNYLDYREFAAEGLPDLAVQLLQECLAHHPMSRPPNLVWRKLPRSAGHANHREWRIVLSCSVLQTPEQVTTTLKHEYAHLLAVDRFGISAAGHGLHWKNCMIELGLAPERTHRYETVRNRTRVVIYKCSKCGATLERNRALARNRVWVHSKCKGRLLLIENRRLSEDRID